MTELIDIPNDLYPKKPESSTHDNNNSINKNYFENSPLQAPSLESDIEVSPYRKNKWALSLMQLNPYNFKVKKAQIQSPGSSPKVSNPSSRRGSTLGSRRGSVDQPLKVSKASGSNSRRGSHSSCSPKGALQDAFFARFESEFNDKNSFVMKGRPTIMKLKDESSEEEGK